jgi:signal transduction histidine kinase
MNLRPTGIDVIGNAPWGTHFCQFYGSKEDLTDILVPYFKVGLENDEFCMWVTSPPLGEREAADALARAMPDLESYRTSGRIEIIPHTEWYLLGGSFDQDRVLKGWVDKLEAAVARGCAGMRLTGNTFWLEKAHWKTFTEYEAVVDSVLGRYRMLALCTYSLDRCGAAEIADVIKNHQFALLKRDGAWERLESYDRRRMVEAHARELEAANKDLEAFSYSVSHDLRAPLRAIDGFSQALLEDHAAALDERGREHLGRVRAAAQRMGELIDDLLQLSRVSRAELVRAPVDLGALAREVAAELAQREPGRSVSLAIGEGLRAEADRRLARIVLENLLGNAWKFTARRAAARIEVGAGAAADGAPTFFVRDDGAGFDPRYAHKLFAPFQRLHGAAEFPGTGIGLAIVQRIVDRHGGRAWAEGEPGRGAVFWFTLPAATAQRGGG